MYLFALCSFISLIATSTAQGATYSLTSDIVGHDFFNEFIWQDFADPTHGRVNYVDQATALSENLTFSTDSTFILRSDWHKTLNASGPGRDSVRIQSNQQWSTHVLVVDIVHMPRGCGTWPSIWEVGADWPYGGEVDIIEGVNDVSPNKATLHTGPGCTMTGQVQTGETVGTDCDSFDNNNAGCGVKVDKANSYGPPFDANGGGYYAMERTNSYINVYFWARNDTTVPKELKSGASIINTSSWGTPVANFPSTDCNITSEFGPNNVIINLTFCGDWAGESSIYAASGCPSDCVDYVNNNPMAFVDAYFQINALRVYE